jgi:probable HAF family extracellular repeat protein
MRANLHSRAVGGLLLAGFALAAQAATYVVEDLGAPRPTDAMTASAINASGIVVGQAYRGSISLAMQFDEDGASAVPGTGRSANASGINSEGMIVGTLTRKGSEATQRAFSSIGGVTTRLGALGKSTARSQANGVNDRGWVVGNSQTWHGDTHAFVYRNGRMEDLGVLGANYSSATAVSNSGIIVGTSSSVTSDLHAFVYRKGVMTDIGTIGPAMPGVASIALGVNDAGTVTGFSVVSMSPVDSHAFRWTAGRGMEDLGVLPGGHFSSGQGINADGTIVGRSATADSGHAFIVEDGGAMVDLNDRMDPGTGAGWELLAAWAINDRGQIVGNGLHDGRLAAFRLTPKD